MVKNAAAILGLAAFCFLAGVLSSEAITEKFIAGALNKAYEKGKRDFTKEEVKDLNHRDLNKACKKWWFDLSGLERQIEVPVLKGKK